MTELDERLRSTLGERAEDAARRARPSDDHLAAICTAAAARRERRRWLNPQVLVAAAVLSACALVGAQLVRIAIDDGNDGVDDVEVVDQQDALVLDTSLPGWADVHFGDWTHEAVQTLYEPALRQRSTFEVTLDPDLPGTLDSVRQCLVVGERFTCSPFDLPPVPLAVRDDDTFGSIGNWRPDVRGGDTITVAIEPRVFTPSGWVDCSEFAVQCGAVFRSSSPVDEGGFEPIASFVPLDPTPPSELSAAEREELRLPGLTADLEDAALPAVRVRARGIDPVPIRANGASQDAVAAAMRVGLDLCVLSEIIDGASFCTQLGDATAAQLTSPEGTELSATRSLQRLDPFTTPDTAELLDCAQAWCYVSVRQQVDSYDYPGWTDPTPQGGPDTFSVVVAAASWPVGGQVPLEMPAEVTAVLDGDGLTLTGEGLVREPSKFEAYALFPAESGELSEMGVALDFDVWGEGGVTSSRSDDGTWSVVARTPVFTSDLPPEVPQEVAEYRVVVYDEYYAVLAIAEVEGR